jgi:hypothetical protein
MWDEVKKIGRDLDNRFTETVGPLIEKVADVAHATGLADHMEKNLETTKKIVESAGLNSDDPGLKGAVGLTAEIVVGGAVGAVRALPLASTLAGLKK